MTRQRGFINYVRSTTSGSSFRGPGSSSSSTSELSPSSSTSELSGLGAAGGRRVLDAANCSISASSPESSVAPAAAGAAAAGAAAPSGQPPKCGAGLAGSSGAPAATSKHKSWFPWSGIHSEAPPTGCSNPTSSSSRSCSASEAGGCRRRWDRTVPRRQPVAPASPERQNTRTFAPAYRCCSTPSNAGTRPGGARPTGSFAAADAAAVPAAAP